MPTPIETYAHHQQTASKDPFPHPMLKDILRSQQYASLQPLEVYNYRTSCGAKQPTPWHPRSKKPPQSRIKNTFALVFNVANTMCFPLCTHLQFKRLIDNPQPRQTKVQCTIFHVTNNVKLEDHTAPTCWQVRPGNNTDRILMRNLGRLYYTIVGVLTYLLL